jgi:hypothetical protein
MSRQLIVTHHAPDLDAIGATWFLRRFDPRNYADAKSAFVNPGDTIAVESARALGFEPHEVVHVDTGLGRFDHHQAENATGNLSATKLVYQHLLQQSEELENDQALKIMSDFITEIDHFEEIHWPEPESYRYTFMLHELIRGIESTRMHDDDSQMQFGLQCLDAAYAGLTQQVKAKEIIKEKGIEFDLGRSKCLALETRNDDTIKVAQKMGFDLVVRKDSNLGHIRIKVRPDSKLVLEPLYKAIKEIDEVGTWFYHGSGKMLINGSRKHQNQTPSPLKIDEVIELIKKTLE